VARPPTHEVAARLAASLSGAQRQTLRDLVRFPLASARQLRALGGRAATSTDQERLVLLADRGLVAALGYPRGPGRALRLWH